MVKISNGRLTFGKYRGIRLTEVPTDYIAWMLFSLLLSPRDEDLCESEMRFRSDRAETQWTVPTHTLPAYVGMDDLEQIILTGREVLTRTNDPEDRKRYIIGADWLLSQARAMMAGGVRV
jgi:hypothetical protein